MHYGIDSKDELASFHTLEFLAFAYYCKLTTQCATLTTEKPAPINHLFKINILFHITIYFHHRSTHPKFAHIPLLHDPG